MKRMKINRRRKVVEARVVPDEVESEAEEEEGVEVEKYLKQINFIVISEVHGDIDFSTVRTVELLLWMW